MKITHQIHPEHKLVISTWAGDFNDSNMLPSYVALYRDPKWQPGFDEIVDLRGARVQKVTADGLRRFIMALSRYYTKPFRNAIVAPADLPYGLARMYEVFSNQSPEEVKVFRNVPAALRWIGIDPKLVETKPE